MYGDDRRHRKCNKGGEVDALKEAVNYAFGWFQGKKCLFLIDDVWPTDGCYGVLG